MRKAVESGTRTRLAAQGRSGFDRFDAFRKQGCVETTGRPGSFDCYYNATMAPSPGRPTVTVNGKGRFRSSDKGTLFEDLGAVPDGRARNR